MQQLKTCVEQLGALVDPVWDSQDPECGCWDPRWDRLCECQKIQPSSLPHVMIHCNVFIFFQP